MLKNVMETIVSNKLEEIWGKINMCHCEKCRDDIMACTLNRLPPKYVSTSEEELYARITSLINEEMYEVTIELLKSIKMVSENPRHELEEELLISGGNS